MAWSKDTLFQHGPDLCLRLHKAGRVTIACGDRTHELGGDTLAILEVFARPLTMDGAVALLRPRMPGLSAFASVMDQIQHLMKLGALAPVTADSHAAGIGSDSGRFDSFPVHVRMLSDMARTRAFQDAIRRTVKPGDVVLEIGTGSGILAATAAMAGARHVYAIERSPFARLARQVMEVNGVGDRVTVIEDTSLHVELAERADMLVAELVGNDPLEEDIRAATMDAVTRLLKPGARLLPERMRILGLPLAVPESEIERRLVTSRRAAGWRQAYGVDLSPLARACADQDHSFLCNVLEARDWPRLAPPVLLTELDLRHSDDVDLELSHTFTAATSDTLTGILVYFEILLGPAGWLSIAPEEATAANSWFSHVWLPGRPLRVQEGASYRLIWRVSSNRTSFELAGPE